MTTQPPRRSNRPLTKRDMNATIYARLSALSPGQWAVLAPPGSTPEDRHRVRAKIAYAVKVGIVTQRLRMYSAPDGRLIATPA